ncbi:hypothetical protein [Bacillus paramycoides]|uniref:hypothetical protein n=1 Tax=Bacillus paramycoides TaxID=2026194 RepID=UPI003D045E97
MRYFKGKQFKKDIILVAVGYYCHFSLSYRDVSEILKERGVSVHPTTIMRWVHEYGNLIYQIWKKKNKSAGFQNLRHASRTIKGIETVHALYKRNRNLRPDFGFSTYSELRNLLTIA